jgi:hypothetical protein
LRLTTTCARLPAAFATRPVARVKFLRRPLIQADPTGFSLLQRFRYLFGFVSIDRFPETGVIFNGDIRFFEFRGVGAA